MEVNQLLNIAKCKISEITGFSKGILDSRLSEKLCRSNDTMV